MRKKVGNACRTRTQIRGSKSKGRQFEKNVEASLQQSVPDFHLTHEKGYIQEYDLQSDNAKMVIECKRLKGISWNELEAFYIKLKNVAPKDYTCFVLFKSNHQPCLVFGVDNLYSCYCIKTFEEIFGVNFIKHTPVKRRKNEQIENNVPEGFEQDVRAKQEEHKEDPKEDDENNEILY